jgi:Poxvirus Late Transcription Factor VLTF3 like
MDRTDRTAEFRMEHTLDVEHRKRVQSLKERVDMAASVTPPRLEDMCDPDISVRLAARLAAAQTAAPKRASTLDEELAYVINAGPVLMKYYDIKSTDTSNCVTSASKKSILRFFLPEAANDQTDGAKTQLLREYEKVTRKAVQGDQDAGGVTCKCCGSANVVLVAEEAVRVCGNCDACEDVVVETERPPSKDTVKDSTAFCYKRNTHFTEWLNQIQGKQQANIPEDVYDAIFLELKKRKTVNLQCLTATEVKEILKKLKFQRWYEHVAFILSRLTGREPLQIHPELEERLRSMFRQIQAPFVKHAPAARTNFLSYSFVLFKQLELLGHDEYLESLALLKSRDKLQAQDAIWKNICKELHWQFIPSL